jgi:hypothetical protein
VKDDEIRCISVLAAALQDVTYLINNLYWRQNSCSHVTYSRHALHDTHLKAKKEKTHCLISCAISTVHTMLLLQACKETPGEMFI